MTRASITARLPQDATAAFLAESMGVGPTASSARAGWQRVALCRWRMQNARYELPECPEPFVALHLNGPVTLHQPAGGTPLRSVPGRVTIVPAGSTAMFEQVEGFFEITTLHFAQGLLTEGGAAARSALPAPIQFGIHDPFVASSIRTLMHAMHAPSGAGGLFADSLGEALTLYLAERPEITAPREAADADSAVRQVCERIETDISARHSLDDLARHVGMDRFQLGRAFKAVTGSSPHRYIVERRIAQAEDMIRAGDLSLAEIALATGFSSQSHLTDAFRKHTGRTPGALARLAR